MTTHLRVASFNPNPQRRACGSCRYRPKQFHSSARCHASGNYIDLERLHEINACGTSGKLWEPIPPPKPRLGLVGWVKRLIWGDT